MSLKDFRKLFLILSTPIQKLIGKIKFPEPRATGFWYQRIESMIMPGDILLSYERFHLSNLFIPGKYKHAAIYAGGGLVVEAVSGGVKTIHLSEWVLQKDAICLLTPVSDGSFLMNEEIKLAARTAIECDGKPYDHLFSSSIDAFYCSELVYHCYKKTSWNKVFVPRKTMGEMTIIPQDYRNAADRGKLIISCELPLDLI